MISRRLLSTTKSAFPTNLATRSLSSSKQTVVPRITERRVDETGPGGRASDAGCKVAVFGASGMLGRYVCTHLGK